MNRASRRIQLGKRRAIRIEVARARSSMLTDICLPADPVSQAAARIGAEQSSEHSKDHVHNSESRQK
jgi:hypothetical protein